MVITVIQGTENREHTPIHHGNYARQSKTKQEKQENENVKFAFMCVRSTNVIQTEFSDFGIGLFVVRLFNISFHIPPGWSVNNRCWRQILEFRITYRSNSIKFPPRNIQIFFHLWLNWKTEENNRTLLESIYLIENCFEFEFYISSNFVIMDKRCRFE